jgi:hypothetical protein
MLADSPPAKREIWFSPWWLADELKMGSWKSLAGCLNQKKGNHDANNQNEFNLA